MPLEGGEKVEEVVRYKVELTKAESVAEFGPYAEKKLYELKGDWSDDTYRQQVTERIVEMMEDNGYDTVVIRKETVEEFVYYRKLQQRIKEAMPKE